MKRYLSFLFLLLSSSAAFAQDASTASSQSQVEPISDNSFLIEEAYNQSPGVVQHVNTFMRTRNGNWAYSFTQEWPVLSIKHQLSFTALGQGFAGAAGGGSGSNGLGDIALNYRYQILGAEGGKTAVAPRVSLLLPTGSVRQGMGAGATGVQFNLPISVDHSKYFVTHWNAGATYTPRAKNAAGERANTLGYNLGQSVIYKTSPNFHLLLETAWNRYESVIGTKLKEKEHALLLNPGVRWAHNLRSGLQIVPGVAIPVGIGPSRGERGVFLYLSFEHAFKKTANE